MNENDLIAEYVKERHPEILKTTDFAFFKLGKRLSKLGEDLAAPIKKLGKQLSDALNGFPINTETKQEEQK